MVPPLWDASIDSPYRLGQGNYSCRGSGRYGCRREQDTAAAAVLPSLCQPVAAAVLDGAVAGAVRTSMRIAGQQPGCVTPGGFAKGPQGLPSFQPGWSSPGGPFWFAQGSLCKPFQNK